MTEYGVRRLVIINSGNYSYADIDLSKPVHLAAPNNRGKSTLVNALQFLFVDDFNRMRFGRRSLDDTKRHYFGEDRSYLVFECLTTSGVQCMLIRGLGSLRGGSFERFVYDGEYNQTDYLDQEEIRVFDDIRTRLANRHFARVKTSDLWQVLAGNLPSDDGKPIPRLNILPIRRRDEYLAFRDVFVRLLALANVKASELRQLIIESHARDVGERKIDVASEYKDEFDRAERSEHQLNFVGAVVAEIDAGRDLRSEIQAITEKVVATAPAIWSDAQRCHRIIDAECRQLDDKLARLSVDVKTADNQKDDCIETGVGLRADLKVLERDWASLRNAHEKWSTYSADFLGAMRDNADRRAATIADLRRHLDQARSLDLATMRRRVDEIRRRLMTDRRAAEGWEHTAAAELRREGMSEKDIANAFRIANPDLLKLVVGESLTVTNSKALLARIRSTARRINNDAYADDAVEMDLTGIVGPGSDILVDLATLRNHIALNEQELAEQETRLKAAEDQEAARAHVAKLKEEHDGLRAELAEYGAYAEAWRERAGLEQRLAEANEAVVVNQQNVNELQKSIKSLAQQEKTIERDLRSLNERKGQLSAAARELRDEARRLGLDQILPTTSEEEEEEEEAARPRSFSRFVDSVTAKLARLTADVRRVDSGRVEVKRLQDIIATKSREFEAQERYFNDEEEEWRLLIESRESLPELEEATKRNWDGLFTTLGARLNAIVTAVSSIKMAVERINRGLKAYQVSNLRDVHINVEEAHDLFPAVEALSSQGSLFQDRDSIDIAKKRLRRMINQNDTIELDSLFELRIQIEEADGTRHQAASLDEIGSTGTGMTAKAMIFVQLVRAIAANDNYRLHFYVDGLGELDDRNLEATARMAVSKGIIPITADPRLHLEPLAHPEVTVYSLGQATDGRFYVDAYKTYYARRRTEPTASIRE